MSDPTRQDARRRLPEPTWSTPAAYAQLAASWSIAFAPSTFGLFGSGNFVVAGWTPFQTIVLAVLFAAVPPALGLAVELVAGLVDSRLRLALHVLALAILAGVFAGHLVKRSHPDAGVAIAAAFAAGAVIAAAGYLWLEPLRTFLTFLAVAPVVSVLVLGVGLDASPLVFAGSPELASAAPNRTPVVLVVLDELPTTSLVDGRGRLDRTLFPNFGKLADDSTWFRDASTVSDETTAAVPAIISGRVPTSNAGSAPRGNVFTLLGPSHYVNEHESITRLCPRSICPQNHGLSMGDRLRGLSPLLRRIWLYQFLPTRAFEDLYPPVPTLANTEQQVAALNSGIRARSRRPGFQFAHLLAPHSPFGRLPDGRQYTSALPDKAWLPRRVNDPASALPVVGTDSVTTNRSVAQQAQQAHLAQAAATDRELGFVLQRLRQTGEYDRSLIIVTADHGAAFEPGEPFRRLVASNAPQITGVPLFVKRPGQRAGRVSRAGVRTTDVLPTIAQVTGIRMPFGTDGRSVFDRRARARRQTFFSVFTGKRQTFDRAALERGRAAVAKRQAQTFGPGTPGVEVFALGPDQGLLGRTTGQAEARGFHPLPVRVDQAAALAAVDPNAAVVPASVGAELPGTPPGTAVAISVNGRVAAMTRAYSLPGGATGVSALLPPSFLRAGRNRVGVLAQR